MATLIEYRDVRVEGDDGPIVAGFSAEVPAGRLTVMVGPSGAGKTTLLRLLNRLDDPDAGAVLFGGRDVRSYDVLDLRRRVQVVGQVPAVEGVDVDLVGPVGAGADLFEGHARLGQPGADVGHQVFGRPALLEVAGLLDTARWQGVDEGVELVPTLVFSLAQVGIDHGRHARGHSCPR